MNNDFLDIHYDESNSCSVGAPQSREIKRQPNQPSNNRYIVAGSSVLAVYWTVAIAEYQKFRHAANALGVRLRSIITRVKMLEEDLHMLPFACHARVVGLTETAPPFVEKGAERTDQLDHGVETAGMATPRECGRLRICFHCLKLMATADGGAAAPFSISPQCFDNDLDRVGVLPRLRSAEDQSAGTLSRHSSRQRLQSNACCGLVIAAVE